MNNASLQTARPILLGGGPPSAEATAEAAVEILDSDDEYPSASPSQAFRSTEWIGCGKVWSNAMPDYVVQELARVRAIPKAFHILLPERDATIATFLGLPPHPNRNDVQDFIYSEEPPTFCSPQELTDAGNIEHIERMLWIASTHGLSLSSTFDDAWLSGALSVRLSADNPVRFPLWIENVLTQLRSATQRYDAWSACAEWLMATASTSPTCSTLAVECQETFEVLPWSGPVLGFGPAVHLTMEHLSRLLSHQWLNDEIMNAGLDYILRDLQKEAGVTLLNSLFVNSHRNMRGTNPDAIYQTRRPTLIDSSIRQGDIEEVYVPLHVDSSHWTLLNINLVDSTYWYGDSLSLDANPPDETIVLLSWWLKTLLPKWKGNLRSISPPSTMPQQTDTHSCGVVVLSTLAHYLLDYDAWTSELRDAHRMQWYLRLSQDTQELNEVSSSGYLNFKLLMDVY